MRPSLRVLELGHEHFYKVLYQQLREIGAADLLWCLFVLAPKHPSPEKTRRVARRDVPGSGFRGYAQLTTRPMDITLAVYTCNQDGPVTRPKGHWIRCDLRQVLHIRQPSRRVPRHIINPLRRG